MTDWVRNDMKIIGDRKDLNTFKNELSCEKTLKLYLSHSLLHVRKNYLLYIFDTPQNPPSAIFEDLIKLYPILNFDIISYEIDDYIVLKMQSFNGELKEYTVYFHDDFSLKYRNKKINFYEEDLLHGITKVCKGPIYR